MQLALDTFKAASLLEGAAQEEFSFTQKQLIAPRRGSGDFAPLDSLSPDIIQKIVESFAQHVGAPTIVLPADVVPSRLGPEPPDSYALLRDRFENSILSACGIPPSLIAPRGTGTAMREGYRQILHALIKPLGLLVAEELQAKIDQDAALSFDALRGRRHHRHGSRVRFLGDRRGHTAERRHRRGLGRCGGPRGCRFPRDAVSVGTLRHDPQRTD